MQQEAAKNIKIDDDTILSLVRADLDAAIQYQDELGDKRSELYKRYRAQPYSNDPEEGSGWATSVDPVIWESVEGVLPGLVEIFNDDFFALESDDKDRADKFKKLIRYQWFRKQDGYKQVVDLLRDALNYYYCIAKITYVNEYDVRTERIEQPISDEEMQQLDADPNVIDITADEVVTNDPITGGQMRHWENVKVTIKELQYRGPKLDVIPQSEFGYTPGYKTLDDCPLVYHKVRRNLSYIKKREAVGLYRKGSHKLVEDKIMAASNDEENEYNDLPIPIDGLEDEPGDDTDYGRPAQEVAIYELYYNMDIDNDGLLEPVVITLCEDIILQVQENPYKRPPFRLGWAYPEPHKMTGVPFGEILKDDQKALTNLKRLVQNAAALSTYGNPITNDALLFRQLKTRKPNDVLKGNPQAIGEIKNTAPTQFILKVIEEMKGDVEQKTGVTRYNQGLDADSLNKTARGVTMIMSAAQMRTRLIARTLGNGLFKGIIRDFIFINQKWPGDDAIRLFGEGIEIHPDDLAGEYDITINIGVGPQEKQMMAQEMDSLIMFQLQAGLKLGLCTPDQIAAAIIRKYKLLGVDVGEYINDPEMIKQQMQQQQQMQQMGGMNGGIPGAGPGGPGGPGGGVVPPGGGGQPGQGAFIQPVPNRPGAGGSGDGFEQPNTTMQSG